MTVNQDAVRIGIVGAGPRGVIALERLCANAPLLTPDAPVEVHLIDPYPAGGGRVWRRDQDRSLLMNTVAGDITVFTDETVPCEGPIRPGPTQYRWGRLVAAGLVDGLTDEEQAEASRLEPWSYASRALQGAYLSWALTEIRRNAPEQVRVTVHPTRAIRLDDRADGGQDLWLQGRGEPLTVDAVVLAQGHFDVAPTDSQRRMREFAAAHGLTYLAPASPAEVDLSGIEPGEPVLLRGLGLNFFDYITLLTSGRGGAFTTGEDGTLRYRPSGREPCLYAGSGRGLPYTSRAEIHLEVVPRYEPRYLDAGVIRQLRRHAGQGTLEFRRDLWPYVAKEVGHVYYGKLIETTAGPAAAARFHRAYAPLAWDSEQMHRLLADWVPDTAARWDWDRLDRPVRDRAFAGREEYQQWVRDRVRWDLDESARGPAGSAFKAAAAMLRDLRDEIRQVISHQGLRGSSYQADVDQWFSGLINFLASGPPVARVRELGALIDAGVVRMAGPRLRLHTDEASGSFLAESPDVAAPPLSVRTVIEAHLPLTDLRRVTDPLLRDLLRTGRCRPHLIPDQGGPGYETGGLDVTAGTFQVIDADGVPHPGRFSYGPPVESVQWVTAIGARPNVGSRTLLQADSIARSCLRTGRHRTSGAALSPVGTAKGHA